MLCATGIALGRWQTIGRDSGKLDPVSRTIQSAFGPVANLVDRSANAVSEFGTGIMNAQRLASEVRAMHDQLKIADLYSETTHRLSAEIDALRRLQSLPPLPGKIRVAADVVGYFPYENRLNLNVGQAQGVRPGVPIVCADGLVGIVQTVEAHSCQVLSITNAGLKIGALVMDRNPSPAGLLRGRDSSTVTLSFQDPKAAIQIGDRVMTSGFSELIPRGILIGKVIQVDDDVAFGRREAVIDPSVSIGNIREVQVIL